VEAQQALEASHDQQLHWHVVLFRLLCKIARQKVQATMMKYIQLGGGKSVRGAPAASGGGAGFHLSHIYGVYGIFSDNDMQCLRRGIVA